MTSLLPRLRIGLVVPSAYSSATAAADDETEREESTAVLPPTTGSVTAAQSPGAAATPSAAAPAFHHPACDTISAYLACSAGGSGSALFIGSKRKRVLPSMNVKDGDTVSVGMVLDDNAGCVQSVHLRAWLRLTCITYRSSVWWLQNVMTSSGVRTSA